MYILLLFLKICMSDNVSRNNIYKVTCLCEPGCKVALVLGEVFLQAHQFDLLNELRCEQGC